MVADGPEERKIYVCPGYHPFARSGDRDKEDLLSTFKMKTTIFPAFFKLVGDSYVWQTSAQYLSHQTLRYHICFISDDIRLPDSIELACRGSLPMSDKLKINQ